MPRGHTHEIWGVLFIIPLSILFHIFLVSKLWKGDIISTLVFSISLAFGIFMLSPDLDTKSKSYARWGILRFIWIPYRKIMKHRSFLSHFPIVSSFIRAFYLIFSLSLIFAFFLYVLLFVLGILGVSFDMKGILGIMKNSFSTTFRIISDIELRYIISSIAGISVGDIIHYLVDIFVTEFKRRF